jgi:hypothetical protein
VNSLFSCIFYKARQNFRKYKQVQTHPDDIEYWMHLQERLNHLAHCMHYLHVVTSVASGDLSRLTHTSFFSKIEQNCDRSDNSKRPVDDMLQMRTFIR